jgi:hypothetical protein
MPEYTFVAHHLFDYYLDQVLKNEPGLRKSYEKQIALIRTNPEIGTKMRYAPHEIAGRIRKKKMGGSGGYSICYVVYPAKSVALGVYVTPEARDDIDYRDFPWDVLLEAVQDFDEGKIAKFRIV